MAKKRASKKAAAPTFGVEAEVETTSATVAEVEEVAPAIVEEPTVKVMRKGKGTRYMTQSEYDAEFAK